LIVFGWSVDFSKESLKIDVDAAWKLHLYELCGSEIKETGGC
jgi:hypothetical protein